MNAKPQFRWPTGVTPYLPTHRYIFREQNNEPPKQPTHRKELPCTTPPKSLVQRLLHTALAVLVASLCLRLAVGLLTDVWLELLLVLLAIAGFGGIARLLGKWWS